MYKRQQLADETTRDFIIDYCPVDGLRFADNQAILSNSVSNLHMAAHSVHGVCKDFGLQVSTLKTKAITFNGADPIQAKIFADRIVLEQFSNSEYLAYNVSYVTDNDVVNKVNKINHMYGTVTRTIKSIRKETRLTFYKVVVLSTL